MVAILWGAVCSNRKGDKESASNRKDRKLYIDSKANKTGIGGRFGFLPCPGEP